MNVQEPMNALNSALPGLPIVLLVPFLLLIMYLTLAWMRARMTDRQIATIAQQVNEDTPGTGQGAVPDGAIAQFWAAHFKRQQQYILVNLRQNQGVYRLALTMIIFGIFLICLGLVWDALFDRQQSQPIAASGSWAAIIAGLFTQFVAGTILVVFKSVFQQTTEYYKSVERMSSIGIALNMFDTLPTTSAERKTEILAQAANVILERQLGAPAAAAPARGPKDK
jgi:hypothetical protein